MKCIKNKGKILLALCILLCQIAGCGQKEENAAASGESTWEENAWEENAAASGERTWEESADSGTDMDVSDEKPQEPSPIEGDWFMLDAAENGDGNSRKVTFKDNIFSAGETYQESGGLYGGGLEFFDGYSGVLQDMYHQIPFEYDGQSEILTMDYSAVFQKMQEILEEKIEKSSGEEKESLKEYQDGLKNGLEEFSDGKMSVYAPIHDDILFLYTEYSDSRSINDYLKYENPNFPNSVCMAERNGTYYTFSGAMGREPEFPYIRSMALDFGCGTMEDCLCSYYANWAGAFSVGFLEDVYGIYNSDLVTVMQELEAEYTPSMVDEDNLSLDKAEDVPAGDAVWEMYAGCPLEEVKYVEYSHDTDAGRQTSGIYLGKTYGLWSVLWTNGDL